MKFAYEDLSSEQFEDLIVFVCQRLLGISVQKFSKGPDGGRDAKFVGTAELHPSRTAPWSGTTIIQAKHTNGYNRHFSETDFFNSKSDNNVIGEEIPRVKKLRSNGRLDHYMLFANRRLAGNAESDIRAHISARCSIPEESIYLCGVEQLELLLKTFPDVAVVANLDPLDSPLIVSPDELAEVVQALAANKKAITAPLDDPPTPRVTYERKNEINNMTPGYAKQLRRNFLKETTQIASFLAAPENTGLLELYSTVVTEFQLKIVAKRKDHQTFDEVMEYITDLLFNRDPVLRRNKRLTRAVLFHMYWNCDIGETDVAEANEAFAS